MVTIDGIEDTQVEFPFFVATSGTSITITTLPEPEKLTLLASGLLGLIALARLWRR